MEVEAPSVDPGSLNERLAANDWAGALEAAEEAEILIQSDLWDAAARGVEAGLVVAIELALYLILKDLDNARHLWRRLKPTLKAPGSQVAGLWEVGKQLWTREVMGAYAAMTVDWAPALVPLVNALKERVRQDELELVSRSYKRIKLSSLAAKLGMEEANAAEVVQQAGWRLDEVTRAVAPVQRRQQSDEKIGLPQLDQLASYIRFLEQKSATSA